MFLKTRFFLFKFVWSLIWVLSSFSPSYAKSKEKETNKDKEVSKEVRPLENFKFKSFSDSDETFVVTAHSLKTEHLRTAASITILTGEDLEGSPFRNIGSLIGEATGIPVFSNGGPKHKTSLFLRGGDSHHILVLVDGVRVNDPSSPTRAFDFSNLKASHIERIEILKGPQSGLYGSDAISGVIHIITKRAKKNLSKVSFKTGSYLSFDGEILSEWQGEVYSSSFLLGFQRSRGFSAANKKNNNPEEDGYEHKVFSTHLNFFFIANSNLDMIFRYDESDAELDDFKEDKGFSDDLNFNQETENAFLKVSHSYLAFNGFWDNELSLEWTQMGRLSKNPPEADEDPENENEYKYKGENQRLKWKHDFYWASKQITTLGVEQTRETMRENIVERSMKKDPLRKSLKRGSFYFQHLYRLHFFFGHMNVRYDKSSKTEDFFTYRFAEGFDFSRLGLILKTSYGTGSKSPSLYQLYSPFGDENLKNEFSRGWDLSLIRYWKEGRGKVEVTYFDWEVDNKINFATSRYENIDYFRRRGLELSGSEKLNRKIFLHFAMNLLDAKQARIANLPSITSVTSLRYRYSEKSRFKIGVHYIGKRVYESYNLSQYFLVNLSHHYQLRKNLSFSFWVENLLNKDYEEVKGYGTSGLSGYFGVSFEL